MSSSKTSVLRLLPKPWQRRREKLQNSIHDILSDIQAAYAVFTPRPDDSLYLFEVIFLLPDRHKSPWNTNTNLQKLIEELQRGEDTNNQNSLVDSFLQQFNKISRRNPIRRPPAVRTVLEESLRGADFTIFAPSSTLGAKGSKSNAIQCELRLSWRSSQTYTGGKLRGLIWKYAEEVFALILQELGGMHVSTAKGDRSLMGIVTKRLICGVDVSRVEEKSAAGSAEAGSEQAGLGLQAGAERTRVSREEDSNLVGVTGLHFILFRVECLGRHQWRIFRGIDVCNAELDVSSSNSLPRDELHQAGRWRRGEESMYDTTDSDSMTATDEGNTRSGANAGEAAVDGQRAHEDPEYVDVENKSQMVPFVDIDIRPILSELANKQCKLARHYRELAKHYCQMDRSNSANTTRALSLLRSALRKCSFESTIRALYDLSRCYLKGIGIQTDSDMARLLLFCAKGMRSGYNTRHWWLRRLVMEIGLRPDAAPERSIAVMALMAHWRLVGSTDDSRGYLTRADLDKLSYAGEDLETFTGRVLAKTKDHNAFEDDPETFTGRVVANTKDHNAFEDITGEHTTMYPASETDVATAVKMCNASFHDIILHSGRSAVSSDAVNGKDAVVINMEALDDIHIRDSRVTVGPAVTMEQFADKLYENALFLPFRDNLIKTVVAGVLSTEPGMLTRSVGLIKSYLREIHVVNTDGTAEIAKKDDNLFNALLAKNHDGIITSLVFDAVPEEEAKKFWITFFYLPYQEDTFKKLTKSAFEEALKLPSSVDLSVKVTITAYGIPVVRVAVAGKEGSSDRDAILEQVEQLVSETNLGAIGFDVPHVTYIGKDIVSAIADGGDVGGFAHGQISTKHACVVASENFPSFVDPYCKVIDYVHGTDQTGLIHFPKVSMKSQMSITPDNSINVTAFFFSPPGMRSSDDPELARIADFKRILNRIIPEVISPPARRSLHPEPVGVVLEGSLISFLDRGFAPAEVEARARDDPEKLAPRRLVTHIPDFKGEIFTKNDKEYKQKAKVYATSSYIKNRPEWVTPYMVAYPEDVADIQAAIKYGQQQDKSIVARSGGHQYCGLSSGGDGTIVLSMDQFQDMRVEGNMATVEVGSRVTKIAETFKENAITIPHGECPCVAIGGHCQTGGYGHLLRSFGLALDYVYSFKIVLADGTHKTIHRPTEKDWMNDKIFWGVLGGGPNSFGILTEITFECIEDNNHPSSRGHQSYSLFQKEPFRKIVQEVQNWTIAIEKGNDEYLPDDMDLMATAASTDFGLLNNFRFGWLTGLLILEMVYGNKNGPSESSQNVAEAQKMMNRIFDNVNKAQTWPNKRRVSISPDNLTPLSHLSDAFVRRQGTTPDGREFKYPYEKRLNATEHALTDGFVNDFVDLINDTIHDQRVRLVSQMGLGGGAYKNSDRRSITSCSRRDVVFQVVYDVFYTEGNQKVAKDFQERMEGILQREFIEGSDIRLIRGSYGETDINKEWKNYYDSEELYNKLQAVKEEVDPDDVFQTRFTVQLPARS